MQPRRAGKRVHGCATAMSALICGEGLAVGTSVLSHCDNVLPRDVRFALRLLGAVAAGSALGLQRERQSRQNGIHGSAGMRTLALVSLGAALFLIVGASNPGPAGGDPMRIAAQVVSGVGFLGGGIIMKSSSTMQVARRLSPVLCWLAERCKLPVA